MNAGNSNYVSRAYTKRQISRHARKRAQQRGISEDCVKLVTAFGEPEHDNKGGIRYLMTEKSIACLRRLVGSTQEVDALRGVYAVLSTVDQTVITIAHRYN